MDRNPKSSNKKLKRVAITLIVILAALAALALTKPDRETITASLSTTLIENAGSKYAETYNDFFVFNIIRAKDSNTAETDTYIGIAGNMVNVNTGFMKTLGNVIIWIPALMRGAGVTIQLTMAAVCAGLVLSVFLALGKISKIKPINRFCSAYIFFFRGSPLLMQLFFVYYGLPQLNPAFAINDKFLAAFIAFSLNSGAYCAEIIRAAIQSIEKGQFEASSVLGLSYSQTMRLIIIPQSIRRLIPPVANEFIMMLKDASLVSIIALADLTQVTRSISSSSSSVVVYIPAMIIYLLITALFTFIFGRLEKRFSVYQ
ncbi:MAG: amino acid ABC transporter permease [Clostridiales bacterium]|nr:amino acid ABC transporter permease [Clostridiales bacterium]MDR2749994.1 amino acid ABC transporter permease [Clostridiales bacterium]